MTTTDALLVTNLFAVSAVAGAVIGHAKGRVQAGALLGLFFSLLGVLFAAVMRDAAAVERDIENERYRVRALQAAAEAEPSGVTYAKPDELPQDDRPSLRDA